MMLALNNGTVFSEGKLRKASLLVEGTKITRISDAPIPAQKEIDCTGKLVLPGAIDVHVHFRCPGLEYKEDWVSASLAALHGGVTTVMDMPNTKPPTTTLEALERKRASAAADCAVNFDAYIAATGDNIAEVRAAAEKGLRAVKIYFGSSTGDLLFNSEEGMRELFALAREKSVVVVAHAEDEQEIRKNTEKYRKEKNPEIHVKVRSDVAEAKAIAALCRLQAEVGNRLHIAHLSSEKGLAEIRKHRKGKYGANITCEVTPNHLFLSQKDYKKLGNLIKCNPSIKKEGDRKALWNSLRSGFIDIIATDHAPHTLEEKGRVYWEAPAGIPGVETMVPMMLDACLREKFPLARAINAMCERPSQLFNWESKGFIREGFDADLVIVDPEKTFTIDNKRLFTKAHYSPFNGRKLKGFVEKTIVRGTVFG